MYFSAIVAHDKNFLIGGDNKLLWNLPEDLKRFKKITSNSTIIMGRKTFESIGRPLPNRLNVILTSDKNYKQEGCLIYHTMEDIVSDFSDDGEVFIIGGGEIYKLFLPFINRIYVTLVDGEYKGDTYFPKYNKDGWNMFYQEKMINFTYQTWIKKK